MSIDFEFIDRNPLYELHPQEYVVNINTISSHENMVAINGALSVDLTGQIASESIGYRMYTGSGGQPSFAIGSVLSKGGRSVIMLRSTSNDELQPPLIRARLLLSREIMRITLSLNMALQACWGNRSDRGRWNWFQ